MNRPSDETSGAGGRDEKTAGNVEANNGAISCPALFIAAPASGQGKTMVTAAIARQCRDAGLKVRVFKTGPDFLDPMILERASGAPVYQLDLWMMGEPHCRKLLHEAAQEADLIMIEGVMGLFDGARSSADLAELYSIPVMAVIDGRAMAETFGAIAHGLATFRPSLPMAGIFANRVSSEHHYKMLRSSLPAALKPLGWLPRNEEMALPERHLGLVQAGEVDDLEERIAMAAGLLRETDDITPSPAFFSDPGLPAPEPLLEGRIIAIARDQAFSFIYRANLDLLREMGAETVFFSPLKDRELPQCDALYLPGGYPELHIERLSRNRAMKAALRAHHILQKPIYAECGGLLYLLDELENADGQKGEMAGLIKGRARMRKKLVNLGLHRLDLPAGRLRGHSFHYSEMECKLEPAAHSKPQRQGRRPEPFFIHEAITASYLHLYFPSCPEAAASLFLPAAKKAKRAKKAAPRAVKKKGRRKTARRKENIDSPAEAENP